MIRVPREDEFGRLQDIERDGGQLFATVGLDEVAGHPPYSVAELQHFLDGGGLWVAGDPAMGYVATEQVDGCLHIEQVTVHPEHAGKGIGRDLLEHVARLDGGPVTLTTFVEVPWNGPYYERLGFRRLADDEVTDGLRRIRQHEADIGLDKWPRMAMRRESVA